LQLLDNVGAMQLDAAKADLAQRECQLGPVPDPRLQDGFAPPGAVNWNDFDNSRELRQHCKQDYSCPEL
jgi:hypothetical protein